jgi:fucose permease
MTSRLKRLYLILKLNGTGDCFVPIIISYFVQKNRLDLLRMKIATRKIQKAWFKAITNPEYSMCHNRLIRDFQELTDM